MAAQRHAVTVERGLNELVVVREMQLARRFEIPQAERMEPQLPVEPRRARMLEIKQHVMVQVVRRHQRIVAIARELGAAHGEHRLTEQ